MILWTKNVYLSIEPKCGETKPKGLLFLLFFSVSLFKNGMTIIKTYIPFHGHTVYLLYTNDSTVRSRDPEWLQGANQHQSGYGTLNCSRVLINISVIDSRTTVLLVTL